MVRTNTENDTTVGRRLLRAGLAAPVVFAAAVALAGHFEPGYSHISQFVSELGAVGAAHRRIFGYGGLFLSGLLTVAFALGMYFLGRWRPAFLVCSLLVALAGFGRMVGGVFPCDPGCAIHDMSFAATVHSLVGFIALMSGAFAPLILAWGLRGRGQGRLLFLSVGVGIITPPLILLMFGFNKDLSYVGLIQRVNLAAFFIWVIAVALNPDALGADGS